jgi:probable HAF family extracellular repeat protein
MVAAARYRRSSRYVHLAAVLAAIALFGAGAPAQSPSPTRYGLTPLGALGGAQSAAYDISEYGSVMVGRSQSASGAYHAFADWDQGLKDLGTLGGRDSTAFATNGATVVGQAQTAAGEFHAFATNLWTTEPTTDLGTLGGTWSAAYDTQNGITVGASSTAGSSRLRAFQHLNGTMTPLAIDLGGDTVARGVNSANDIVGYACTAGNALCRPFLLSNGVTTLLGPANRSGVAHGINIEQQVVGSLAVVAGAATTHAFLYANGVMTDLGTLGGASSEARALNDRGEVVGSAQNAAGQPRAFLWRDGQMTDLNTLIPAGPGWTLESAASISFGGQIVGYGTLNGKRRAFLLTPPADIRLFIGGTRSQSDSNLPRGGIEVGRHLGFVTSAIGSGGPNLTLVDARMVHTLTGPATFVEARGFDGDTCELTPTVVTCRIVSLSTDGTGREIHLRARATGTGTIEHHATLTSGVPDPNLDNNSISESNRAVSMSAFTLAPTTVPGGQASIARFVLTDLAPAGDAVIRLTSSRPDIVPVPPTFIIPGHAQSDHREFPITPAVVSSPTTVEITASYGLVTITRTLTVVPPALKQLYLNPTTVIGGCGTSAGKVVLTGSAPAGGAVVPLSNTNTRATVPSTVTVPAGSDTVNFSVATTAVTANASGTVTASYGGVSQALSLGVRPIRAQLLTLSSSRVRGGTTVSGTVTLECPAAPGAVAVSLTSGNAAVAQPTQASITLSAGATSGTFSVRTSAVTSDTPVTIYAWVFGVRKSVTFTVTP